MLSTVAGLIIIDDAAVRVCGYNGPVRKFAPSLRPGMRSRRIGNIGTFGRSSDALKAADLCLLGGFGIVATSVVCVSLVRLRVVPLSDLLKAA